MARTQGRLLATMWNEDDWLALTKDAQRLYMLLLGQSKLTLAGCIDLMPHRWVRLAADETRDELQAAIDELVERHYIAVDESSGELLIRTLAKNDVTRGAVNRNLIKGFWSAWIGIISRTLRKLAVDNAPEILWDKHPEDVPDEATTMRRSPRLELPSVPGNATRCQPQSEPQSERPSEPSYSFSYSDSDTAATGELATVPTGTPADPGAAGGGNPPSGEDLDRRLDDAARLVGLAEAERRGPDVSNPDGYARSRIRPLRQRHDPAWRRLLEQTPTVTARQLADTVTTTAPTGRPADPTAPVAAAAEVRYAESEARRRGEACTTCHGSHIAELENGEYVQCPDCTGTPDARDAITAHSTPDDEVSAMPAELTQAGRHQARTNP